MPKASALIAQQPRLRDTSLALRLIQDLQVAVADWVHDEHELAEMSRTGDLPGAKRVIERIVSAPTPYLDRDIRRQLVEPVDSADALQACVLATASLGGPRSREETRAYLRDLVATTLDAGASVSDLHLVHRWLRTRAGSPDRPARLPTFEFRPSPGVWDELLHEARWRTRPVVEAIDRRAAGIQRASGLLGNWPAIEAEHHERQQQARARWEAEKQAEVDRHAAHRRQIETEAEKRKQCAREDWRARREYLEKLQAERRAALPADVRAYLDAVARRMSRKL